MDIMNAPIAWLEWTGIHMSPWKLIGLTGALMFGARWLVQFVASRRARRPVIPRLFWVMSLAGSAMTLSYFVFSQKQDAVGVLQNLFPAFTAAYSLWLDIRHRGWQHEDAIATAQDVIERSGSPASIEAPGPRHSRNATRAVTTTTIRSSPPERPAPVHRATIGTAPAAPAR